MPRRTIALSIMVAAIGALPGCQPDRSATRRAIAPATPPIGTSSGAATTRLVRDGAGDPFLKKADGHVVRVPDVDKVIIDLGVGDNVSPGMTFDVYNSHEEVPPAGVAGKATMELVRIAPGYSECRIIRRTPGVGVNIGDLVVKRAVASGPPR
jgi:hypothetical protein